MSPFYALLLNIINDSIICHSLHKRHVPTLLLSFSRRIIEPVACGLLPVLIFSLLFSYLFTVHGSSILRVVLPLLTAVYFSVKPRNYFRVRYSPIFLILQLRSKISFQETFIELFPCRRHRNEVFPHKGRLHNMLWWYVHISVRKSILMNL